MKARGAKSRLWVLLLLGACGCGGGARASAAVGSAVINTALAAGASAASRAAGGCYANCPPGTACDEATGMCLRKPCRGECGPGQECIEETLSHRCVVVTPPGGTVTVEPQKAKSEP